MLLMRLWEQGIEAVIIFIIVIVLAFAYHELAHALVADWLGDPTPRSYGRITLNPLPHLSMPLLVTLLLFGFGGAYTPVRPHLLRGNMRQSHALVAVAGPAANLLMAVVFALLFRVANGGALGESVPLLAVFLNQAVFWNIFLMLFNLIPIPPLDGFTILQGVLPGELSRQLDPLRQYGMLIFILIFFVLPAQWNPLGQLFGYMNQIMAFLLG